MNARANFLLALAVVACGTENLASLEPGPLCAEPDPQPACIYQNTCANVNALGRLAADLGRIRVLYAPIQYNNQAPANTDTSSGRVNSRDAFIEEFRIKYTGVLAGLPAGSVKQSFSVPAGASQTAIVEIIPADMAVIIGAAVAALPGYTEVVAEVKARGRYADGTTFETGSKRIPIDVCIGCFGSLTCATAGQSVYCCPQFGQSDASCKCL